MSATHTTDCVVVGAGPGGMFLALLLARQGVRVTLLESHKDFDRDFRGDTVHPTTLELLDSLGVSREVHAMPHGTLRKFTIHARDAVHTMADLSRLPTRFPYVMLLPQEKLLAKLAEHAVRYPHLRVEMGAQAGGLIRERGEVRGVTYQKDGRHRELRATLTVAADGRFSKLRKLAGLEPVKTAPPMDIVWFRVPRRPSDPGDQGLISDVGRLCVLLERGDQWQVGFLIPKGAYQALKASGIESFRGAVLAVVRWFGDRVDALDWGDLTLLAVESSRLTKWYVPGLLLIGDAAHVMSPVGGVGINYAVQDAVAAANLLAGPLLAGDVRPAHLAAVQRKREWPVRVIQFVQGVLQRVMIRPGLDGSKPFRPPLPMRLMLKIPVLRDIPARLIGLGVGRERLAPPRAGV